MKCEPGAEGHCGADPYREFEIRLARSVLNPITRQAEIVACYRPIADTAVIFPELPAPSLEVARLGHELRTPLTAIIGFAECLGDPSIIAADDPKRGDYARIIGTSARHMLDLVNDLPNASVPVEPMDDEGEKVDLAELIGEAVGIMRLNVEAQRARLSWEVAADVPLLLGSRHAFRQILINLISNGLKFAPEGTVVVRAIREGEKIRLTVEDNGIGVSQRDLPRLGEPFFRGSATGQDTTEGQGLGLGIVRDIVRRHQGHFDVMSRPGVGTRVIVTFMAPDELSLSSAIDGTTNHRERAYA
jgi:cell cycle sensor histidine kinase DivJ